VETYRSSLLFHGPTARAQALAMVPSLGRLLHEPFGDDGLKIAESREVVELMNHAPVGDRPGVVVIGPVCRAPPFSTDVLLKSIEEFDQRTVRPVLWAFDEAEVSATLRSRCLARWCPGTREVVPDAAEAARRAVDAVLLGDAAAVIEALHETDGRLVLEAAAGVLLGRGLDDVAGLLWESVRLPLRYRDPTPTEALAAFLGAIP